MDRRGYTILEVMIFMAVSGFMFIIAAGFVSGKQSKTEFRQGMNAINQTIQDTINDVSNGFYPSTGTFNCTVDNIGNPPSIVSGGDTQGTHQGCVFMGKVIQLGPAGTDDTGYNVFSVMGRQYTTSAEAGTVPTKFSEAKPKAIFSPVDLTDYETLEHGVRVTNIKSGATPISGIGFFSSFGSYDAGSLNSGSQSVWAVKIPGASPYLGKNAATMAGLIESEVTDGNVLYQPDVLICFESGTGQFATLRIGGDSGQRLTSSFQIQSTNPAECL